MNKEKGQRIPFVGRQEELRNLDRNFEWVVEHESPRLIFIHGNEAVDVGVGKTTLVKHFLERVQNQDPKVFIVQVECNEASMGSGYAPFAQVLASFLNKAARRKAITQNLITLLLNIVPAWLMTLVNDPGMATLLGPISKTIEEAYKTFKGKSQQTEFTPDQVLTQYIKAISEFTQKHPAMIFIDNFHLTDLSSLDLLKCIIERVTDRPIMFIVAFRTVEAMELGQNAERFRSVHGELTAKDLAFDIPLSKGIVVEEYVKARYGNHEFPPELIERVQSKTEGHALFIYHLFNFWEWEGITVPETASDGRQVWRLALPEGITIDIPRGFKELLISRMKKLNDRFQEILTWGSVEGMDFTAQTIAKLLKVDQIAVYDEIETLQKNYWMIDKLSEREKVSEVIFDFYHFTHQYIRDIIYDELPPGKKAQMHHQVGECLEQLCKDRKPVAGQLARHFHEAGELLKSAYYMLQAARYERERYAWAECQSWCEKGLEALSTLSQDEIDKLKFEFLELSGVAFYYMDNYAQSCVQLEAAVDHGARCSVDAEKIVAAYALLADAYECLDEFKKGIHAVEKGKEFAAGRLLTSSPPLLELKAHEGLLLVRLGKTDVAIQHLRKLIEEATVLKPTVSIKRALANAYNNLAIALSYKGIYPESIPAFKKAIEFTKEIGDKSLETMVLINLMDDYIMSGDFSTLEPILVEAKAIARQIGDGDAEAYSLATLGVLLLQAQKLEEAAKSLQSAIDLWGRLHLEPSSPFAYADLAQVYLAQGAIDLAYQQAQKSLALTTSSLDRGYASDVLAQVEAAQGKFEDALIHHGEAIFLFQKEEYRHFTACSKRHYAETLIMMENYAEARPLIDEALVTFQDLKLDREIVETQKTLEKLQGHGCDPHPVLPPNGGRGMQSLDETREDKC